MGEPCRLPNPTPNPDPDPDPDPDPNQVGCVALAGAALLCHLFVHDSGVLACAREWLPRGLFRSRKETLHSAKMV